MASQAQSADILQIALPSAFHYRNNVIRVPQAGAPPPSGLPLLHQSLAICPTGTPQPAQRRKRIHAAQRANPPVPQKHLLPQIPRLRPQLPLMHAVF